MILEMNVYYSKTEFPSIYGDAMLLNSHCKLSLFDEDIWTDVDPDKYIKPARLRFLKYYNKSSHYHLHQLLQPRQQFCYLHLHPLVLHHLHLQNILLLRMIQNSLHCSLKEVANIVEMIRITTLNSQMISVFHRF